jgi:hypothetical protein
MASTELTGIASGAYIRCYVQYTCVKEMKHHRGPGLRWRQFSERGKNAGLSLLSEGTFESIESCRMNILRFETASNQQTRR